MAAKIRMMRRTLGLILLWKPASEDADATAAGGDGGDNSGGSDSGGGRGGGRYGRGSCSGDVGGSAA
jgi:hypothetical protein